jgi:hypothetical protein
VTSIEPPGSEATIRRRNASVARNLKRSLRHSLKVSIDLQSMMMVIQPLRVAQGILPRHQLNVLLTLACQGQTVSGKSQADRKVCDP